MKNNMILVAAVPSLRVADVDYNTGEILWAVSQHRDCGLIVFPELCVTGYTCADLFGSALLLEKAEQAMFRLADLDDGTCI